ncbi:OmpA family protein [uncultured Dechloromonas sp.]|uniref:OmpA family protein n=1 Tax=uncultured Dechloromonas sp. TaxID=171719 RepID=UPI0025CCFE33|nr:OmpA family protein [uncultured Dechloromonas sp.]
MRATLPAILLLSALLAACSTKSTIPPSTHISQNGPLRVHPGLLGQPVPAELQQDGQMPRTASAAPVEADKPIRIDPVGLRTQRSVYFELNSADIKADYDPALRAHARYLAEHPKARVRIEGNADERGSVDYNRKLGLKRAENVRSTLVSHGAGDKQVNIRTLGEARPKLTGHDESSWAENRRADVVYEIEN